MSANVPLGIALLLLIAKMSYSQEGDSTAVRAPGISVIEPLTANSALVKWDSVDAAISQVQIQMNEHSWDGYETRGSCAADRGWFVVSGLIPQRHYRFQLCGSVSPDTCLPGPDRDYRHMKPVVDWAFIPAGEFTMGDSLNPEATFHVVRLTSFLLSTTEITNEIYREHCAEDSVPLPEDPQFPQLREYVRRYPEFPVVNVNWFDALSFCNSLSRQMNLPLSYGERDSVWADSGVRLPTEAEWEYSARIAQGTYPWGNTKPSLSLANFAPTKDDSSSASHGPVTVMSFPATPLGLFDLAGNVWEWCNDWYSSYTSSETVPVNPVGPHTGMYKIVRGGSWADSAATLRSGNRAHLSPSVAMSTVGFRVARSYPISSPKIVHATHAEEHNALAK